MARFKTVLKNSSYLFGTKLVTRLLFTAFIVYAAARLGSEQYGTLAFAMAMVELFSWLGELGLTQFGARELLKLKRQEWPPLNTQILTLQMLSSIVLCVVGLMAVLAWNPGSPKTQLLLMGLVPVFLSGVVNTTESVLIASQNFLYSSIFSLTGRIIYLTIGFVAVAMGAPLTVIMAGYLIAVTCESLLRMVVLTLRISKFSPQLQLGRTWQMLVASLPFAALAIASLIYGQVGIIMLEIFKGDAAVGVYSLAYTLFIPFVWLATTLAKTIFPGQAEIYLKDKQAARYYFHQWYRLLVMAGIPIAAGITLLAGTAMSYLPDAYHDSELVLTVLVWTIPLLLIAPAELNVLQIIGCERKAARTLFVSVVATIILELILVPRYGPVGAAISALGGGFVREVQYYEAVRRNFLLQRHFVGLWVKPLLAGAAMMLFARAFWSLPAGPWIGTAVGAVLYVGLLFAMRAIRPAEIKALLKS